MLLLYMPLSTTTKSTPVFYLNPVLSSIYHLLTTTLLQYMFFISIDFLEKGLSHGPKILTPALYQFVYDMYVTYRTYEDNLSSYNSEMSWALVKNESIPISLSRSLPHAFLIHILGKAWGRDLERNRWGWPHSLQVPLFLLSLLF